MESGSMSLSVKRTFNSKVESVQRYVLTVLKSFYMYLVDLTANFTLNALCIWVLEINYKYKKQQFVWTDTLSMLI